MSLRDKSPEEIEAIAFERAEAAEKGAPQSDTEETEVEEEADSTETEPSEPQETTEEPQATEEEEAEGEAEEKPEPTKKAPDSAWYRKTRRKLKDALDAQNKLVQEFAPLIQGLEAAKQGNVQPLLAALQGRGLDSGKLKAAITGKTEPEGELDPRVQAALDEVKEAKREAAQMRLETTVRTQLASHPALKIPGGFDRIMQGVAEGYDARTGKAPSPKAVADKLVADLKASAEALGIGTSKRPKVKVTEGGAVPDKKAPVAGKKPLTPEEWEELAFVRATAAERRGKGGA